MALPRVITVVLTSFLCTTSSTTAAAGRTLKVSSSSAKARPVTRAFDKSLLTGSPDLPADHPRIVKRTKGCEPEQVHLTYWSATSVLVSYASCDAKLNHTQPVSTKGVRSVVFYGTSPNSFTARAEGVATSYAVDFTPLKRGISYASPVLHHVLLKGLTPGQTYHYKVASSTATSDLSVAPSGGRTFSFTLPKPAGFPLKIGVVGDAGQTFNTTVTLERLIATKPQLVINAGDFAYADRWMNATEYVPASLGVTYEPKWDTWARLFEPLLSSVPMLHTDGNHERAPFPLGDQMTSYNARYPTPYLSGHDTSKGPSHFTPATAKGDAFSNLYYAVEVPGVMKFISLTSYAPGQTFDHSEPQYTWLSQEFAKTNRSRTPWVIVNLHAPLYNTYVQHFKENECMRQSYEALLVKHQVDLIFHGHTHAYERMNPVVDYKASECGPQYITIGDGGNVEGLTLDHIDIKQPDFCKDPVKLAAKIFAPRYQPQQCFSYQNGRFCPEQQPEWSAYREPGFGFGTLELLSEREAKWTWTKHSGPAWQVADSVTITRDTSHSSKC